MLDNEKELVERAKTDPKAFGVLYDRYVDRIYRYAVRQMQDEALAQDVTAVTFEKAYRHIHRFEWQGTSFVAWLYRIARNEAVSLHRRRKWLTPWRQNGRTEDRFTETAVVTRQRYRELRQALSRLRKKDREIISLRYFEGLSSEEVATILDCSTDNVYVRLHRALKRLEQQLSVMENAGEVKVVPQ